MKFSFDYGGEGEEESKNVRSSPPTEALAEVKKRTKFSSPSSAARVDEVLFADKSTRKIVVELKNGR